MSKRRKSREVLNAFRHHRVLRLYSHPHRKVTCRVLNAFRHHRVLRPDHATSPANAACAQRLSASQGATLPMVQLPSPLWPSAQRLSASQGATQTPGRPRRCQFNSAQRLSASQGATHRHGDVGPTDCVSVLNAFRHHRVLRCLRARSGSSAALCAQRLSASQGATHIGRVLKPDRCVCSTPFGITGCYALLFAIEVTTLCVLNAFRHHRVLRGPGAGSGPSRRQVLNAFRHHRVLRPRRRLRRKTPTG